MMKLEAILAGAIMVSSLAIALFFLRFWRKSRDRLFGFFAVAFLLLGIERLVLALFPKESSPLVYLIRLAAFLLFLFAIIDKNRKRSPS